MSAGDTTDGAVMVVAVWFDDGALRVRLTAADALGGSARPIGVAGSIDDACDVVRRWLEGLQGTAASCEVRGRHPS